MNEIQKLKSVLRYEPETGLFFWVVNQSSRAMAGSKAGHVRKRCGYVKIVAFKKYYAAHRLAWAFMHGVWPKRLDHKDRNRSNNAISNLRECTSSQNALNRKTSTKNTSGHQGVVWNKSVGKWQAQAAIDGTQKYLGIYDSREEAAEVYELFCKERHGEFYVNRLEVSEND